LLKKLMCYEVDKRISADEALKHPWIKRAYEETSKEIVISALTHLKNYNVEKKLQ
jgi:serine/threonine protein kinase